MAHTFDLQGRLAGCGCQGVAAGGKPFRGAQLHCRTSTGSKKARVTTQCTSTVANVKLPATHKEASQRALDQLRASSSIVNREYLPDFLHQRQLHLNMALALYSPDLSSAICCYVALHVTLHLPCHPHAWCASQYQLHSFCIMQGMLWRRKAVS